MLKCFCSRVKYTISSKCLQEDKCEKLSMGMLSLPCTKMRAVRIGWNVYCTNKFKFVYFAHKIFIVQWA